MELSTSRPRVLGWLRSVAILDGDWGTSIAYVLGIAFALGGYYSGLHLLMMTIFMVLVALNYITICRLYPNGGGVYSSVSHRSRTFAVIGALLLSADFVVTASLSVLAACHYFNIQNPNEWAMAIILGIGILNWFGPRHAGTFATIISVATFTTLLVLVLYTLPISPAAVELRPAPGGFMENWRIFVGIILAISGIESISNMTGVMKDPIRNSRRAILIVLSKISLATIFFGLAMLAIPNLDTNEHKEEMIRFLGESYVGNWFGPIVGGILGLLLISAGNTAINALTSIQFLMSVDKELPVVMRRLNKYGVPVVPLIVATLVPIIILFLVHDVLTLAQMYAIGVVGAILINIGSTATDRSLKISTPTRIYMTISSIILLFIEATIAIEKTKALIFAASILAIGLTARMLAKRQEQAVQLTQPIPITTTVSAQFKIETGGFTNKMMVAVRGGSEKLLRHACEEAKLRKSFLFILQIKQIAVVGLLPDKIPSDSFVSQEWMEKICNEYEIPYRFISIISSEVGYTIAEQAATLGIDRLVLGATQRTLVERALRGDVLRTVSELLPEEIQLVIYRA